MATIELTKDNFEAVVGADGIVLVEFWAAWCAPCRQFAPVFEEVSEQHSDIVFGTVDAEAEEELASAFGIQLIPALMVVRDRAVLYSELGPMSASALGDLISQARGADMVQLHRKAAAERAG